MSKRKHQKVQRTTSIDKLTVAEVVDLAIQHHQTGNLDKAASLYRKILRVQPNNINALHLLGVIAAQGGDYTTAADLIRRAISYHDAVPMFYQSLGNVLRGQGKPQEAIAQYRRALELNPAHVISHQNLLVTLNCIGGNDPATLFAEHQRFNEQHALPLAHTLQPHQNDRSLQRRLKIGYVSPDFWNHAVAHFVEPILARHNPEQFEIYCYYNGTRIDTVTQRLQHHAHHWSNCVNMTDEALAEQIRQEQIDILVDLTGHNPDNRLLVFARKPAPIQVAYLGYPSTTGLTALDYRLTDNYADPEGIAEAWSSEKLVRLPNSYFCYQPNPDNPLISGHPTLNINELPALKNGYVTFGSFNNYGKVNEDTVKLWAAVLTAVPDAKLLVKTKSFSDLPTRQAFKTQLTQLGVAVDQLILAGYVNSTEAHLRTYQQVDIGLDTYPYHGATTTLEALWMGVPVVTLVGERHVSRMGLSILSTLELNELITTTPDEYVACCVKLAKKMSPLKELRRTLRERLQKSPLLDAETFTRQLETAYRQMWEQWVAQN